MKDQQDVARYVVIKYPHSFICKSHGKQEVDVQSFLPVEAEISVTKCERTDKRTDGQTNGWTDGQGDCNISPSL